MDVIIRGDFNRYLLRPINPLFHLISETVQADAIGELVVGITIFSIACTNLKIHFGIVNIIILILITIAGSIIYTSIKLLLASISFWLKTSIEILQVVYNFSDFVKYPTSIYSKGIQFMITIAIPFAFTAFIPAAYFIGKVNLNYALGGTILAAVISFSIAYAVWLQGIKVYESAGS